MGPTSDLARDPRWGRTDESYGEDAFLADTMAVALAAGIQGDDPKYWQATSLLKHVFANSNENTRGSSSSDFDERLIGDFGRGVGPTTVEKLPQAASWNVQDMNKPRHSIAGGSKSFSFRHTSG